MYGMLFLIVLLVLEWRKRERVIIHLGFGVQIVTSQGFIVGFVVEWKMLSAVLAEASYWVWGRGRHHVPGWKIVKSVLQLESFAPRWIFLVHLKYIPKV